MTAKKVVKRKPVKKVAPARASQTAPAPKMEFYEARVGCWNCDERYSIDVLKGHITPQFLVDAQIKCRSCGCDTLKMFSEYKIEKGIMKEVILHHRIEQLHDEQPKDPDKNHNHIA